MGAAEPRPGASDQQDSHDVKDYGARGPTPADEGTTASNNVVAAGRLRLKTDAAVETTPWHPSTKCQAEADAFCASSCLPKISSSGCKGPLTALRSGPGKRQWRCYAASTLEKANSTYAHGTCYCSRNDDLLSVLRKCGDPAPSPLMSGCGVGVRRGPAVVGGCARW